MDINHLHLAVQNMERAMNFYEKYFGFRHKIDHGSVVFMTNNNGFDLALAPGHPPAKFPPWFHFGTRLNSIAEVRALYKKFQAEAPEAIETPLEEEENLVFFRCIDPDGYLIEVYWE